MKFAEHFSKVPTSALFNPSQLTEMLALPAVMKKLSLDKKPLNDMQLHTQ